ncbi:MAG: bifunctional oligoribonuclease/PAP phosphatase NrnA [Clostridia bacterium]|jgi:phosphoesterase RecJ-like protein|nr:bifunctional oligoribonuclease/PAP phosphatase NrnA [Clostridia bacterium]
MNYEIKKQILDKMQQYDRIILFRHVRNDGDCVGATKGLKEILRLTWPEKEIYLIDTETAKYLEFMGPEDAELPDEMYTDALGIVLDTASESRISNKKYTLCREVIKIDHHIPLEHYGSLEWVEEERSSCCEMIVDFYNTFRDVLKINSEAATHLYTGMVTDSGRFKYSGVTGDTLRCAAVLLDVGVDTDLLFARLYLEAYEYLKFKAHIYERMQITENGVAYIYIDQAMQKEFNLSLEQASACIGNLDSIRGCISWIAFIESGDEAGTIRVRLRSRFVHINSIAEKYRGGGHACASGATVYNREEVDALLADTDALVKEYKETHEGWL